MLLVVVVVVVAVDMEEGDLEGGVAEVVDPLEVDVVADLEEEDGEEGASIVVGDGVDLEEEVVVVEEDPTGSG